MNGWDILEMRDKERREMERENDLENKRLMKSIMDTVLGYTVIPITLIFTLTILRSCVVTQECIDNNNCTSQKIEVK